MRRKIEDRLIDVSGLEERVGGSIDPITVANALCLYCEWRAEREPLEWFFVDSYSNPSGANIGLGKKRAEVYKRGDGGFNLLMHEDFPGRRNFGGFVRYLWEYVRISPQRQKERRSKFYWRGYKK